MAIQNRLKLTDISELEDLSLRTPNLVHIFSKTVHGKKRQFIEARNELLAIHSLLHFGLLRSQPLSRAVHGYKPGRSNVTHAACHLRAPVIMRYDIFDFFPSIRFPRVHKAFIGLGASPDQATLLTRLTTFRGTLPLGYKTSPALANQVTKRLVRRLCGIGAKHGFTVSVYADNIEISGSRRIGNIDPLIRSIFSQEGFALNLQKTRKIGSKTRKEITGIVVNDKLSWGRNNIRVLRARIHRLQKEGPPTDPAERFKLKAELSGFVSYISSIDKPQAEALGRRIKELFSATPEGDEVGSRQH